METSAAGAGLPSPTAAGHVPERSCVACRRKRPQGEFLRLTKAQGGWAVQTGHRTGRSCYLCADTPACWAEKRLKRTFGAQAASLSAHLQTAAPSRGAPAQRSSRPTPVSVPPTSVSPSADTVTTGPIPQTMQ